jgi:hypothetical protein
MHSDVSQVPGGKFARFRSHRRLRAIAWAVLATVIVASSTSLAAPAAADSEDSLRAAVMSVRSASCGPLRSDPLVEQATEDVNRSDDVWLNHEGRKTPVDDPLPILKDSGYGGSKAVLLRGAARTDVDAIKGLLIEGYLNFPDCSFSDYGVSVLRNRTTNYFLTALVMAG